MTEQLTFSNARIVLPDEIINGALHIHQGTIADVSSQASAGSVHDLEGDLLIPGLVELHTDHLESHLKPRPKVSWPVGSALMAFDSQIAASGITTVFDCVRAGNDADYAPSPGEIETIIGTITAAQQDDLLRSEHHVHLRCEICSDEVIADAENISSKYPIRLMSLMDHTPGARQFEDLNQWRIYYGGKSGRTSEQLDQLIASKQEQFERNYKSNRATLVAIASRNNIVLASHDDASSDHVTESIADDVSLAEFPTTFEAAALSHKAGIQVLMGAPNVVRGGSHSGNVAAEKLARSGHLDILSSDYVPASLLYGVFDLDRRIDGYGLPAALRTVTKNPAEAVGFTDRGEIAPGKRADLVRVHVRDGMPIVREVYREGRRVL